MLNHWTNTNREFQERISETQDTQAKLTSHMHLVDKVSFWFSLKGKTTTLYWRLFCQEILEMDCLIDQLRSARQAKQGPLKVMFFSSHFTLLELERENWSPIPHYSWFQLLGWIDEIRLIDDRSFLLIILATTQDVPYRCTVHNWTN
jgi:hypothetical protein